MNTVPYPGDWTIYEVTSLELPTGA